MTDIINIFLSIGEIILAISIGITTLIYVEIITINKWGLNKDLENDIHQKFIDEINQINEDKILPKDDEEDIDSSKVLDPNKPNKSS